MLQKTRTYALWTVSFALAIVLGGLGWQLYSNQNEDEQIREVPKDESKTTQTMLNKYFTVPSDQKTPAGPFPTSGPPQSPTSGPTPLPGQGLEMWNDFVSLMPLEFKDELLKCPVTDRAKLLDGMLCALEKVMFEKEAVKSLTKEERIALRDKVVAAFFLMRGIQRRGEGKTNLDVVIYDPKTEKVMITDPELLKQLKEERDRSDPAHAEVRALKPELGISLGWLFGLLRSTLRRKGRQMREDCKFCA